MEKASETGVIFRHRRPSGSPNREPSLAMTAALRHLSRASEMKPLLRRARETGRDVVIEVFHSRDGQPLLIHTTLLPGKTA